MNSSAGESSAPVARGARRVGPGLRFVLQSLLAIGVLVALVSALSRLFKPELESLGRGFLERFGALGLTLGTFLADAFHFPIPPQFYMLASITGGRSAAESLVAIAVGSMAGGVASHLVGRHLLWRLAFLRRVVDASRARTDWLFARYGYWAVAVGSVSPVPFSLLCNLSGLYRVPFRMFLALSLFRIPRLVLFYGLIWLSWSHAG
jgi:membrane protein YqaA with SNARE-associated domain